MQFLDLKTQYSTYKTEIDAQIQEVLDTGQFILGPKVKDLEKQLAEYVDVKHCIGVASGTDALMIALMALGIGTGDAVITTPFTFIATAEVITLLGARPVFVDIQEDTYNIDPLKIEELINNECTNIDGELIHRASNSKIKAIIPVSLFGQCSDMDEINLIAHDYNLKVIEDAAQSFGAQYKGQKSCNLSTIGVTSFFPAKPLGCYGDGGAVFTNDDSLAEKMNMIRAHGSQKRYQHKVIGINGRLDAMQAAVLLAKLPYYTHETELRKEKASIYSDALRGSVVIPQVKESNESVFAQYSIRVKNRDELQTSLRESGIPTAIHYPKPLHLQEAFNYLGYKEKDFPVSENVANEIISLPFGPFINQAHQDKVISEIKSFTSANNL